MHAKIVHSNQTMKCFICPVKEQVHGVINIQYFDSGLLLLCILTQGSTIPVFEEKKELGRLPVHIGGKHQGTIDCTLPNMSA